jgi:hypothetical protein
MLLLGRSSRSYSQDLEQKLKPIPELEPCLARLAQEINVLMKMHAARCK